MALLSPIGRPVDNWWDYDKDLILKTLHEDYFAPFNSEHLPTSMEYLIERTDMDYSRVESICLRLEEEGFIRLITQGYRRFAIIAPCGIEFVERHKGLR